MERKEKLLLILLIFLVIALPLALFLVSQRQEIRRKAAGCTISYDTTFIPADRWRLVGNKYQILVSADNKFRLNWTCTGFSVASYNVRNDTTDITTRCKPDLDNNFCPSTGCVPANSTSGMITCSTLTAGSYNISVIFRR